MKEVLKNWEKELWIAQEKEYGGKILIIKQGHHTSQHYHKDKKETIYCFKGEVDTILKNRVVTLKEGDDITLNQRTIHRIIDKKINPIRSIHASTSRRSKTRRRNKKHLTDHGPNFFTLHSQQHIFRLKTIHHNRLRPTFLKNTNSLRV